MERRKRLRAALRASIFALLRLLLFAAIIVGGYLGGRYIFIRSAGEVTAIQNRPKPQFYLEVDQPVRMVVLNDKGEKTAEISGASVKMSSDQRKVNFTGADVKTYEDGAPSLHMTAGNVEYDTLTEDITLTQGLTITTRDKMVATADEVDWRRVKDPTTSRGKKVPSFRFPKGVDLTSSEGNKLHADYMQADRELMYLECVGHVEGDVDTLQDTGFISQRGLANVGQLKLEDFKKLRFQAEQVIFDKTKQVVLCTSRMYKPPFVIYDLDGRAVDVGQYQKEPKQVVFSKEGITISANHLEAHIAEKWVDCLGNIGMIVPPADVKPNDDKAMKVVKRYETRIQTENVRYFWGRDYILTNSQTRVEQQDRLAIADKIVYWGEKKEVLLDGNISIVQGSGQWMVDEGLIEVENHDMRRAVTAYSEVYADRSVIYLNNNDFIASGNVRMRQDERETAADTMVYQDTIKRITALGNVKFRDKDGQTLLCNNLVYHNQSKYLEIKNGMAASMRIPAKYANDINAALAQAREKPEPPQITDPLVEENKQHPNPNEGSKVGHNVEPLPPPAVAGEVPPLSIPGAGDEGGLLGPVPGGAAGKGLKDALDLFMPPGTGTKTDGDTSTEPKPPPDGKTDGGGR
jgi:lipopolysaccharide export system protein LptA